MDKLIADYNREVHNNTLTRREIEVLKTGTLKQQRVYELFVEVYEQLDKLDVALRMVTLSNRIKLTKRQTRLSQEIGVCIRNDFQASMFAQKKPTKFMQPPYQPGDVRKFYNILTTMNEHLREYLDIFKTNGKPKPLAVSQCENRLDKLAIEIRGQIA